MIPSSVCLFTFITIISWKMELGRVGSMTQQLNTPSPVATSTSLFSWLCSLIRFVSFNMQSQLVCLSVHVNHSLALTSQPPPLDCPTVRGFPWKVYELISSSSECFMICTIFRMILYSNFVKFELIDISTFQSIRILSGSTIQRSAKVAALVV